MSRLGEFLFLLLYLPDRVSIIDFKTNIIIKFTVGNLNVNDLGYDSCYILQAQRWEMLELSLSPG